MSACRVVVTGVGPVTSAGVGAKEFHRGLLDGVSAVRTITRFDPADLPVRIAAEVDLPEHLTPPRRDAVSTDRCVQLAAAAAHLALEDSGLDLAAVDRDRVAVAVGTGCGGAESIERGHLAFTGRGPQGLPARFIPMSMANSTAAWLSIRYGLTGPCATTVTACASGADALVAAHQMIVTGEADVVLAGGAEAPVTPVIVGGFARMRALSTRNGEPERASRPFDADRDGFVIGEGAALLVLEEAGHAAARGAVPLAEFRGYGRSADAHHVVAPRPDGSAAARAVTGALRSAGLTPADVSHVNAHGTGTVLNDAAEARALHTALGPDAARIPVSATKSVTGHTLGAAGAIEAVASVQAVVHGVLPPTANLDVPDPETGLDLVGGQPRETEVTAVLSDSFAFGGHNVVLAFTRPEQC
ncbi:beta-ketoacyl-[acyl-carrier-protein] synthase family protein [Streptomyces sp. TRM 70361]|uniref:beta-ketoacyl-[acyl-carrier-protein] synthase family protein n=1 Tax=Streptomyces sp. TRM 70361 TaxID=3116553 RepID=UPI002E7C108D|nr:beta-ketoacyl-[acyl-carrier-protein] synthase family protein [Streptomyces sp. TRM 70361]MEE1938032.1 beta-ketoacyl-[acyl-carrier-protein] synthase family protein [Streptomyces sp. TRM 70361]